MRGSHSHSLFVHLVSCLCALAATPRGTHAQAVARTEIWAGSANGTTVFSSTQPTGCIPNVATTSKTWSAPNVQLQINGSLLTPGSFTATLTETTISSPTPGVQVTCYDSQGNITGSFVVLANAGGSETNTITVSGASDGHSVSANFVSTVNGRAGMITGTIQNTTPLQLLVNIVTSTSGTNAVTDTGTATLTLQQNPANAQNITNIIAGGGGLANGPATSVSLPFPFSLAQDKNSNVYIISEETAAVYKLDVNGQLTVVAGNGLQISRGSYAIDASFFVPSAVAVDPSGNLLVTQGSNSAVRKVDLATGAITLVAGNGSDGYSGDNSPATEAQLRSPDGVAVDVNGNIFISDSGNSRIRRVDAGTGIITTIAGNGTQGFSGDSGPATAASINFPTGITVDSLGNVFFADLGNYRVRRIDVNTGFISTVAGNGNSSASGDGGPALQAGLGEAWGVTVDSGENLYLCDLSSRTIRRVDAQTGTITTVAGNGLLGFSGDGGPGLSAALGSPTGVLVDSSGNLLIADRINNRVRKVDAQTAIITTIAGNGSVGDGGPATRASLFFPEGVAVDSQGNVLIADTTNFLLRSVNVGGSITTIAGKEDVCCSTGDGGPATAALLGYPTAIATDSLNNIFIAEVTNRVRRIDAVTGIISTVAGNGTTGFAGDLGPATSANLNSPSALVIDHHGNFFINDSNNQRIRRVDAVTGIITTVAGNGTAGFSGDGGAATGASLNLTAPSVGLTAPWSGAGGIAVDASGNLFFSDTGNHRVRRVDAITGSIETVAGSVISCNQGQLGDGGPATSAALCFPEGLVMDPGGNLFIADLLDHRVRRVDTGSGTIETVAGTGGTSLSPDGLPATATNIATPRGVTLDGAGNLYVAAVNPQRIFRVRFAPANNALFITTLTLPLGVAGVGYRASLQGVGGTSPYTWSVAVGSLPPGLRLNPATGTISGVPTMASGYVFAVQVTDSTGALFARGLTLNINPLGTGQASATIQPTSLRFGNQVVTTASTPQAVTVTSSGTAPLLISSIAVTGTNPADFPESNNCPLAPTGLGPGESCQIFVTFAPTAFGARSATLIITDNQGNIPGSQTDVTLTGTGADVPVVASTTYNITGNPFTVFTGSAVCPPDCNISGSFTLSQPLPPNLSNATITPTSFSFTVGTTNLNQANVTSASFSGISTDASGYITSWAISLSNANYSIVTDNVPGYAADSFTIVSPQGMASNANSPATWPKTVVTPLTFTASPTPVSNIATLNCPSGTVPCTDPNAHSLKLTVPAVSLGFTLTVTSVEVPFSEANGVCPAGATEATNFNCRFVTYFALQKNPDGSVTVPQCVPYSNGNCVYYRVSNTPPETSYTPGVLEYIAWNNTSYTPPPFYNANNPRLFDDPDDPPYNINHQFVFDITTYYKPTGNYVGVDNGIGGGTKHFNDFVVAYPAVSSYSYALSFVPPLSSTRRAYFEQGDSIAAKFKLSPNTPAGIAMQAPHHVGYSVLLDTNKTGCGDFSGTIEPTATPPNAPVDFTYYTESQFYELRLRGIYPAGQYKMLLSSDLAPEQCAVFVVTKDN